MSRYLICLVLLLAGLFAFSYRTVRKQRAELERQSLNILALNDDVRTFKTKAGDNATQVRALRIKTSELDVYSMDLERKVKDAGVKIRDLKNAAQTSVSAKIDTVIINTVDTIKGETVAEMKDAWNDIRVIVKDSLTSINISLRDTITIFTHVKQKRFLFFRVGKPILQTTASNVNKNISQKTLVNVQFD